MRFIVHKEEEVDDMYPQWCVIDARTGEKLLGRYYSKACAEQFVAVCVEHGVECGSLLGPWS